MLYPSFLFILPRESPVVIFKHGYVLHRGLWSLGSAEFPVRQNILNSGCMGSLFPGAKDCKSISAAHFQKETVGVSGNTNLLCPPKQCRQISQVILLAFGGTAGAIVEPRQQ